MLTIALDSSFYVAYDLANCRLYKAWKGGVLMESAAYSDRKNVQPTTWGEEYINGTVENYQWVLNSTSNNEVRSISHQGYYFENSQIFINYQMVLSSGDTIDIQERPEYYEGSDGLVKFERTFSVEGAKSGDVVVLSSRDTTMVIGSRGETKWVESFAALPEQVPPTLEEGFDNRGLYWMTKSDCFTCHEVETKTVGPSFAQISARYKNEEGAITKLTEKIKKGGTGVWGSAEMNAHEHLSDREITTMLKYILAIDSTGEVVMPTSTGRDRNAMDRGTKPGHGTALAAIHPSYDGQILHKNNFRPRVGAMDFTDDGRLLVTTWDQVGGVYLIDGVETGDTNQISVMRIAQGLAEPLGIKVVDGEIYVLQKQELTKLLDLDGDEIIDEYQVVCDDWGVTNDFHEFAFGLEYMDGYFYATLSMAMRLLTGVSQHPDRGRTMKIGMDGTYESLNYGLRTPNGIGIGIDGELFVTDNQGEWLPANKLIHVKAGDYHGMQWGITEEMIDTPKMVPPTIWLPEDEIGNSPSEPVLMQDGPYKGQMLHGDVSHGGIKRDFIEKINGVYQGAVFRFSQGFEAGVNRMVWGADGALYIGGVGMSGGWSWKGNQFGLERIKYNGKSTFEMLAIRAKPEGFEIEFTEPISRDYSLSEKDFNLQQWWYLPTASYGGPKKDLEVLRIERLDLSEDRTKVYLKIANLKEEHVVYFAVSEDLKSADGQELWSGDAWYTLNNIPVDSSSD